MVCFLSRLAFLAAALAYTGYGQADRSTCKAALMAGKPPHYIAHKVQDSDIVLDGSLDDVAWRRAPKVDNFESIYGRLFQEQHPSDAPWYATSGQILWSEDYVYVAGHLQESQLWAIDEGWTLPTQQVSPENPRFTCEEPWIPSCPYRSADFEFFFSPGLHGSPEWYKEFEFNVNVHAAKGPSVMTLSLPRPYHDLHGEIPLWLNSEVCPVLRDYKYKVAADGRVNDPAWAATHPNRSWSVEVKIPIDYLIKNVTGALRPADGVQWRQAFSRVEYHLRENASAPGGYEPYLATDTERRQGHLDRNFVWPPTFMYDIHMPDLWSFLQFSSRPPGMGSSVTFDSEQANWPAYGTLSRIYYAEWYMFFSSQTFSFDLRELQAAYERLADPRASDAFKEERQILSFPNVPAAAWDPACAHITVEEDSVTGWKASVRTHENAGEVWTMDGWRRVRVAVSSLGTFVI